MTEPNDHALRRRRAQAYLDADPLQSLMEERERHEAELRMANAQRDQAQRETAEAREAAFKERTANRRAWEQLGAVLEGTPEQIGGGQMFGPAIARMIERILRERNTAIEKVGEVIALLERVEPFLNKCRRMKDEQGDLGAFRREASVLYSGIGAHDASAPFMASLVTVVRRAATLHHELGKLLDVGILGESAKAADLRLGTDLAGVPVIFKQPCPDSKPARMTARAAQAEIDKWRAEDEEARKAELMRRDMEQLELIKLVNTPAGNDYAERRDAYVTKKKAAAIPRNAVPRKKEPMISKERQIAAAAQSFLLQRDIGESWAPVDGWPSVPGKVYNAAWADATRSGNATAGPLSDQVWDNGEIIVRNERDASGQIVGITTTGGRYMRNLDGSYTPEDTG